MRQKGEKSRSIPNYISKYLSNSSLEFERGVHKRLLYIDIYLVPPWVGSLCFSFTTRFLDRYHGCRPSRSDLTLLSDVFLLIYIKYIYGAVLACSNHEETIVSTKGTLNGNSH